MGSSPSSPCAAALHDRHQVLQIAGPGVGHLDAASGLGQASRVDGGQHLGRQIDRQTEQFAHHRRGDDAAVLLGEVESAARQQFVESLVGQRHESGRRAWPQTSAGTDPRCTAGRRRRSASSKFAWNGMGCSGGSGTGPSLCSAKTVAAGRVPSDATKVPSLISSTCQMSENRDKRVGVPLLDVVHRVFVAQHPVVRQRIGHHGRVERIVREVLEHRCVHCSGDGGSACRIESSQPSRSAGATLIQVTISAGGLSFHDG